MKTNQQTFSRRALARIFAATWLAMAVSQPGFAAPADISDVPMAVLNSAKPNVMFTLDDSGSMQFEVIPENDDVYLTFPRPRTLYGSAYYGSNWEDASYARHARFTTNNRYARCYRNAQCNPMYYNPATRYRPWSNADGSLMANATPTAAYYNPYNPAEGTRNLTTNQTDRRRWTNDNGSSTYEDVTYYPATHFRYIGTGAAPTAAGAANNTAANYTRVEITAGNAPYTKGARRTDCAGTTCTYAEEIQNFANWFTYYRSRILAARAGVGLAFSRLPDGSMRTGFAAINKGNTTIDGQANTSTIVRGVRLFTGADRTQFFAELYGHVMPAEGTPLRHALDDVGQYFSRTDDRGPWGATPGSTGGTQHSCRQNFNIFMTDGYWNGANASTATGNIDNTSGPTNTGPSSSFTYTPANPFNDAHSSSLADVAMYYWKNDLRTGLTNNVPTDATDPAFWQHLVNYTVGFGVAGNISQAAINSAFTTTPQTITWPDPHVEDSPNKVDDLAHAAVNSRGGYYSAADPETFATALQAALDDVIARSGSAAAVAVANTDVSIDNTSYASSYNSGNWSGQLSSYPIDTATGAVSTTPTWSAQAQLNSLTSSTRRIVTYSGSAGVQFQPTTASTTTRLTTAQQATLNSPTTPPGPSDSAAVLEYVRGDRSGETSGTYRTRTHLLGDIVNAEPVVVTTPSFAYGDPGYAAFKTAQNVIGTTSPLFVPTRIKTVFQPANDGMVHAFLASDGSENWSYIPSFFLSTTAPSQLRSLSRRDSFAHRYFVDATPVLGDVDFDLTGLTNGVPPTVRNPDWRSLLVGGLGKGGRGYYALDVTTPTVANEAAAAGKVLWEFPVAGTSYGSVSVTRPAGSATTGTLAMDINKIGYTHGKPVIVKTKSHGWVALVTSGYNNGTQVGTDTTSGTGGDGHGYLFVLNAETGALLHAFDTEAGTGTTPSGLAYVSAYVENPQLDNTVQYVYGGDLLGNVWRFDLNNASTSNWRLQRLTSLFNASNQSQPVTSEPELATVQDAGVAKRMVYVGTGQYLGSNDIPGATGANPSANQTQTMYALVDDLALSTAHTAPIRSNMQQRTLTLTGGATCATATTSTIRTTGTNPPAINYTTQWGWYVDLPCTGERVNTNPTLALGTLYFTSNIPNSDPCTPGGSSWLNILDYKAGTEATPLAASSSLGNALASRPILIQLPSGEVRVIIRLSDSTTPTRAGKGTGFTPGIRRQSWKEIKRY